MIWAQSAAHMREKKGHIKSRVNKPEEKNIRCEDNIKNNLKEIQYHLKA
jgi:hypothetical protein